MLHSLYEDNKAMADFLTVYILEAHAVDEWPISSARYSPKGTPVSFAQHKEIRERHDAAQQFVTDFNYCIPMVLDTMDDEFQKAYAPWPIRIYIVEKEDSGEVRVRVIGFPKHASYDVSIVTRYMQYRREYMDVDASDEDDDNEADYGSQDDEDSMDHADSSPVGATH